MDNRSNAILTGLYFSKFNSLALKEFGFTSYKEAFNILGLSMGINANSLKNYRDEFDPFFPNNRKGRHKRPIREYCKIVYENFHELNFYDFTELIKAIFIENYEIEKITLDTTKRDYSESVAKRLATGKAAEEYFKANYNLITPFKFHTLFDTTNLACGFDYKLSLNADFLCIEVKGLNTLKGTIQMTEKEFYIAQKLQSKYCLFIVKNFIDKPCHDFIFNPLDSRLLFTKVTREIIQTSFTSTI